jgi:hypothetical protein
LPLPALVAALLSMRAGSQQSMLDGFYAALRGQCAPVRGASDRAFAKARARLHMPALAWLNEQLIERAEHLGWLPRWRGLRLVAADASLLRPAVRACHRSASAASRNQRLFALYLPGAELTLHASVHDEASQCERAMLVNALDALGPDDVLLLDRGYPAAWLINLLAQRGIRFIMRCDGASWPSVREFVRSSDAQRLDVALAPPSAAQAADWGCTRQSPRVRLVRNVSPCGRVRVLLTNVEPERASAADFAALYHQRWRIEEAFKRLKHRLHIEAVSGLSQHALIVEVAAKVLADNLAALMCAAAHATHEQPAQRRCNRSYAAQLLARLLPPVLLRVGNVLATIAHALRQIAANTQRHRPGRHRPRPPQRVKPHPSMAYKG